jgi:hypothetical protein
MKHLAPDDSLLDLDRIVKLCEETRNETQKQQAVVRSVLG